MRALGDVLWRVHWQAFFWKRALGCVLLGSCSRGTCFGERGLESLVVGRALVKVPCCGVHWGTNFEGRSLTVHACLGERVLGDVPWGVCFWGA